MHIGDSAVYGHLWVPLKLQEWFSDTGRTATWLEILAVLAEVQAEHGLIPASAAQSIRRDARVERLDLDEVARLTRESGHSTLGLIRCVQDLLPADAREWVYYGATVQDLTDTWTALTLRRTGDLVERELDRVRAAVVDLARRHRDTVMPGRTHGQPGLPITFGFKAAIWAAELQRHAERLAQGRPRWELVQLAGALGTMEFWGEAALRLQRSFAQRLQLGVPQTPWLTARDGVAEFVGLLGLITATLAKVGNELYELQRPEIGEVREPFRSGVVGSITMPHKRNPELSEHLDTLARVVRADAAVALEGVVSQHERDGRAWKAEWAVVPEACCLTVVALQFAGDLMEGLDIQSERMAANVGANGGYVLSSPLLRALAAMIGKHQAQQAVYEATMRGLDQGLTLREAVLGDRTIRQHLSEADIDALLDVAGSLGMATAIVDRVLETER